MSAINKFALTIAAHNHVAIEATEQESLALFVELKAKAEEGHNLRVNELGDHPIPDQYADMKVHELESMIEHEAACLVGFGGRLLEAAHRGLIDAVEDDRFEMDATRWCLNSFAEKAIEKAFP